MFKVNPILVKHLKFLERPSVDNSAQYAVGLTGTMPFVFSAQIGILYLLQWNVITFV